MKHLKTYESFIISIDVDIIEVEYEYQFRDIDSGIWYKRMKGNDVWSLITEEEFDENATNDNKTEWQDK